MFIVEIITKEGLRYYRDTYEMCLLNEGPHIFHKQAHAMAAAKRQQKHFTHVFVREVTKLEITYK